jgi:hypothetical protein
MIGPRSTHRQPAVTGCPTKTAQQREAQGGSLTALTPSAVCITRKTLPEPAPPAHPTPRQLNPAHGSQFHHRTPADSARYTRHPVAGQTAKGKDTVASNQRERAFPGTRPVQVHSGQYANNTHCESGGGRRLPRTSGTSPVLPFRKIGGSGTSGTPPSAPVGEFALQHQIPFTRDSGTPIR